MTLLRHVPAVVIASAIALGCGSNDGMQPKVPETTSAEQPAKGAPNPGNARGSNPNAKPKGASDTTGISADGSSTQVASPTSITTASETPTTIGLTDDQILQALHVSNANEVEQGKLAQARANKPEVKQFAAAVVRDESDADAKGYSVARSLNMSLADSVLANELQGDGQRMSAQLRAQSGPDFDQAYIEARINAYRQLLNTIDNRLVPNAKSGEVRRHLATLRAQVDSHLREAHSIRSSFNPRSNP